MKYFRFEALLQRDRWIQPAFVGIDVNGAVKYLAHVAPELAASIETVAGVVLPGFQNAHSHAFQYAMAGLAEIHPTGTSDDFWSWREAMYRCARNIDPEQLEAIAAMLYVEMLRKGYTHVAEFHYLHHDRNGKPYAHSAEMGERLIAAAKTAGIKITLVPIFYQMGNFGEPPQPRQRRFISATVNDYFRLLDDSQRILEYYPGARLGFGVHSLRAVNHDDIIATFTQGPGNIPFHLHAAEQEKEVADCLSYLNKRPVQWLLDNLPLGDRFHIVHCTHMTDDEVAVLAVSRANVVLCPGTEGNLGDGIFKLSGFIKSGGRFSIGTDSHISLNPVEDLRWLDYSQRLVTHRRNTFNDGAKEFIGRAFLSGRKAMEDSNQKEYFELGMPFDCVVYSSESPLMTRPGLENILPTILYTGDSASVMGTIINGQWIVKHQQHVALEKVMPAFQRAINSLNP